jgi:hypothetical protein
MRESQHALAFAHGGMMLFEMRSCFCPRWDDVFRDELVLVPTVG